MRKLAILVLVIFLLFGCSSVMQKYASAYAPDTFYDTAGKDILNLDTGQCKSGACSCFVCDENSFSPFGSTSLSKKTCYVDPSCTQEEYFSKRANDLKANADANPVNDKELNSIRSFMIGAPMQGFAQANARCYNLLDMSVQWLIAKENQKYTLPTSSRASCYLEQDVMPVYVLYSKDDQLAKAVNAPGVNPVTAAQTAAHQLKGTGPAIITTDAAITYQDFLNPDVQDHIIDQLEALRNECPATLLTTSIATDANGVSVTTPDRKPNADNTCHEFLCFKPIDEII